MRKKQTCIAKKEAIKAAFKLIKVMEILLEEKRISELDITHPIRILYTKIKKNIEIYNMLGTNEDIIRFEMMKRIFRNSNIKKNKNNECKKSYNKVV